MAKIKHVAASNAQYRPSASTDVEAMPDIGQSVKGGEIPPAGQPLPPYYLAIYPSRWCVLGGRVVPFARKLMLSPGVNQMEIGRDGKARVAAAQAALDEEGWTVIPWNVDGKSYLKKVKTTGGYISRWETLHPGSEDVTVDEKGYADFWENLIATGQIDPPPVWVLDKMTADIKSIIGRDQKRFPHAETETRTHLQASLDVIISERSKRAQALASTPSSDTEDLPDVG